MDINNKLGNSMVVLIIDMQDFFLKNLTLENRERIISNQLQIINFCTENKIPIIVMEYNDKGRTTEILQERFEKISAAKIVTKEFNSGFRDTNLNQILENMGAKELVLMGINASGCVQDTAIGALKRGYKIVTAKSVIASSSRRDGDLVVSSKWYSKNGKLFEDTEQLMQYLTENNWN